MPKRFFFNRLQDYAGSVQAIDTDTLKRTALRLCDDICKWSLTHKSCDGGLYVGQGGVSYALWYVATRNSMDRNKEKLLTEAKLRSNYHLQYSLKMAKKRQDERLAFLLGTPGIRLVSALVDHSIGGEDTSRGHIDAYADVAGDLVPVDVYEFGADELFVGRAGYLLGVLNLRKKLNQPVVENSMVTNLCRSIIESGRRNAQKRSSHSTPPLVFRYHGTEYLGAAHGMCSILQVLLSFPSNLGEIKGAENDVRTTLDWLLSLQTSAGNFPCAIDEIEQDADDDLVHWCHGAPGVIYLMAKAFLVYRQEKYLDACKRCAELIWSNGLLRKGAGICHGVAGNAYSFLVLYQLTKDMKYLHRAHQFGKFMLSEEFKKGARTPDTPLSLYEGLAGTACFFVDLLDPDNAEFPLFPHA